MSLGCRCHVATVSYEIRNKKSFYKIYFRLPLAILCYSCSKLRLNFCACRLPFCACPATLPQPISLLWMLEWLSWMPPWLPFLLWSKNRLLTSWIPNSRWTLSNLVANSIIVVLDEVHHTLWCLKTQILTKWGRFDDREARSTTAVIHHYVISGLISFIFPDSLRETILSLGFSKLSSIFPSITLMPIIVFSLLLFIWTGRFYNGSVGLIMFVLLRARMSSLVLFVVSLALQNLRKVPRHCPSFAKQVPFVNTLPNFIVWLLEQLILFRFSLRVAS